MEQAGTVPAWQQVVARTSQALLAVYLIAMLLLVAAVATGRAALSPLGAAYLVLPAVALGQAVFNSVRSRRADDPARSSELARHSGIQAGIGLVLLAQSVYYWAMYPQTYTDW